MVCGVAEHSRASPCSLALDLAAQTDTGALCNRGLLVCERWVTYTLCLSTRGGQCLRGTQTKEGRAAERWGNLRQEDGWRG